MIGGIIFGEIVKILNYYEKSCATISFRNFHY
jgi:hypothetical protein